MKFVFIVQSDGRGHMSQALVLAGWLEESGHELCTVLTGRSQKPIPDYFTNYFKDKLIFYDSPGFFYHKDNKGINFLKTFTKNLFLTGRFMRSVQFIRKCITKHNPDVVINFYDGLGGLAHLNFTKKHRYIAIGHHFYLTHPDHKLVKGKFADTFLLKLLNKLTSNKADLVLALSLRSAENHQKTVVVPPIIRNEVLKATPTNKGYFLVYAVNHGFADDIKTWHTRHMDTVIHFFWDGNQTHEIEEVQKNLFFHKLNQAAFTSFMTGCDGLLCTAGFESCAEALFLQKPVMLVPVPNHIEQTNNAADACRTGYCVSSTKFELDTLLAFSSRMKSDDNYKAWVRSGRERVIALLTNT